MSSSEEEGERRQHYQRPPGSALTAEERILAEIAYQNEPNLKGEGLKAFVVHGLGLKEEKAKKRVFKWFERRRKKARKETEVTQPEESSNTSAVKKPPRKRQSQGIQEQSYDEPAVCTFEFDKYEKIAKTAQEVLQIVFHCLLDEPQTATSLWSPLPIKHSETPILNEVEYYKRFHMFGTSSGYSRYEYKLRESSGITRQVSMEATELALMLTKRDWSSLFPSIVLNSSIIQRWAVGSAGSPNGSMQLMFNEIRVPSPVVPTRKYTFLRTCKELDEKFYMIADMSLESMNHLSHPVNCHRIPSGCLIQGVGEGVSLVTWIEQS